MLGYTQDVQVRHKGREDGEGSWQMVSYSNILKAVIRKYVVVANSPGGWGWEEGRGRDGGGSRCRGTAPADEHGSLRRGAGQSRYGYAEA